MAERKMMEVRIMARGEGSRLRCIVLQACSIIKVEKGGEGDVKGAGPLQIWKRQFSLEYLQP